MRRQFWKFSIRTVYVRDMKTSVLRECSQVICCPTDSYIFLFIANIIFDEIRNYIWDIFHLALCKSFLLLLLWWTNIKKEVKIKVDILAVPTQIMISIHFLLKF